MAQKQWLAFHVGGGGDENSATKIVAKFMNQLNLRPGEALPICVPLKFDAGGVKIAFGIVAFVDPAALTPEQKQRVLN